MARIRTIKPEFWTDAKTGPLSDFAKLLFLGLLNYADDYGVVRWEPCEWRARLFPYRSHTTTEDVAKALTDELLPLGLIIHFARIEDDGPVRYAWIKNFDKHQVVNKPSMPLISGWRKGDTPASYAARMGHDYDESRTPNQEPTGSPPVALPPGKERKGEESSKPIDPSSSAVGPVETVEKPASKTRAREENQLVKTQGDPLDKSWETDKTDEEFAVIAGLFPTELQEVAERFKDYHLERGTHSTDWRARWRNWCRDEAQRRNRRPRERVDLGGGRPPPGVPPVTHVFLNPDMHPAQWAAWQAIKPTATNKQGGWYFPSEWPPGHERADHGNDPKPNPEPVPQAAS